MKHSRIPLIEPLLTSSADIQKAMEKCNIPTKAILLKFWVIALTALYSCEISTPGKDVATGVDTISIVKLDLRFTSFGLFQDTPYISSNQHYYTIQQGRDNAFPSLLSKKDYAIWLHLRDSIIAYDLRDSMRVKHHILRGDEVDVEVYRNRARNYFPPIMDESVLSNFRKNPLSIKIFKTDSIIALRLFEPSNPEGDYMNPYSTLYFNNSTGTIDSFDKAAFTSQGHSAKRGWRVIDRKYLSTIDQSYFTESYWDSITGITRFAETEHHSEPIPELTDQEYMKLFKDNFTQYTSSDLTILYFWFRSCYACRLSTTLLDTMDFGVDPVIVGINPYDYLPDLQKPEYNFMQLVGDGDKRLVTNFAVASYPTILFFRRGEFLCKFDYYSKSLHEEILECLTTDTMLN